MTWCESFKDCPVSNICERALTDKRIKQLKKKGMKLFTVICPIPNHDGCDEFLGEKK